MATEAKIRISSNIPTHTYTHITFLEYSFIYSETILATTTEITVHLIPQNAWVIFTDCIENVLPLHGEMLRK